MFRIYKEIFIVLVYRLYIVFRSETLRSLTETPPYGWRRSLSRELPAMSRKEST